MLDIFIKLVQTPYTAYAWSVSVFVVLVCLLHLLLGWLEDRAATVQTEDAWLACKVVAEFKNTAMMGVCLSAVFLFVTLFIQY